MTKTNRVRVLRRSFRFPFLNKGFVVQTPTVIVSAENQVSHIRNEKEQEKSLYCRFFGEPGKIPEKILSVLKSSSKILKVKLKVKCIII